MDIREINQVTRRIIGLAFAIHRDLGPGLFESVYERVLAVGEIKSDKAINPIDVKQLLTYLRLTGRRIGLILNFGAASLQIKRLINGY